MFKYLTYFGLFSLIVTAIIVLGTFGLLIVKLLPYALIIGFIVGVFMEEIFGTNSDEEKED